MRKTAPGFGYPDQREAVEKAFAALDRPAAENPATTEPPDSSAAQHGATQVAVVAPPARISARRPSMYPRSSRSSIPPRSPQPKETRPNRPALDVEIHQTSGRTPKADPRFLELHTRNNIYVLNGHMQCVSVRSARNDEEQPQHAFLGARLVGGQLNGAAGVELSYPLPRPGSTAVFETRRGNKPQFTRTSEVLRIVLHMNIARVTGDSLLHTWADLSDSDG